MRNKKEVGDRKVEYSNPGRVGEMEKERVGPKVIYPAPGWMVPLERGESLGEGKKGFIFTESGGEAFNGKTPRPKSQ